MARLPKSIIKKYGISKKAWSVFRNHKKTRRTKSKVKTMAKRKRTFARTFAKKTFFRRTMKKKASPESIILPALAYGALRDDLGRLAQRVPYAGTVGDNVVLGVAGYLLAKKGSGMMRDFGIAALAAEATNTGRELRYGTLFSKSSSTQEMVGGATFA